MKRFTNADISFVLNIFAILLSAVLIAAYYFIGWTDIDERTKELTLSIIPNIIAVLFTYLIINFFLDKRKMSPSQILKNELVKDIIQELPYTSEFLNFEEANKKFDFQQHLKSAKEIYLVGYSLVSILDRFRPDIVKALLEKVIIKIIVMEPQSVASKLLTQHQRRNNLDLDLIKVLDIIRDTKNDVKKEGLEITDEQFEIRFTSWPPSCALMFINPSFSDGSIRMQVYPLAVKTNHSRIKTYKIISKKEEGDVFDYLIQQFYFLWEDAKKEKHIREIINNRK